MAGQRISSDAIVMLAVLGFGLAWHALFASFIEGPNQWDSAYSWEVARHIARGEGAVTDAIWAMAWQPHTVRHPADLHWSPLPSRVLVPALWISESWRFVQLVPVLLAALWGPLAVLWARRLRASRTLQVLAGLMAATGLGALPFLGVPDSVGLFGVLGAGALLTASQGHVWRCALLCALAALTRGDGFLLGLACAVSLPWSRAIWPAVAGLAATAGWSLRSYALVGTSFFELRGRVSDARAVGDLLLLHAPPDLGVLARLEGMAASLPMSFVLGVLQTGLIPAALAVIALWGRRRDRSLWAVPAFVIVVLLVDNALAPGVASKGTIYRSLGATLPVVAALSMVGARDVLRGLPSFVVPSIVAIAGVLISQNVARSMSGAFTTYDDCGALSAAGVPPGAPVLAYEPLHVTARCEHPAVQIPPDATSADLADLAIRYQIQWAVVAPVEHRQPAWRQGTVFIRGFEPVGDRVLRLE
ncbi:MAG: hypothetical protein AB8H79_04090 [Myxococcota bacterium]